jgi:hypothetical protein
MQKMNKMREQGSKYMQMTKEKEEKSVIVTLAVTAK